MNLLLVPVVLFYLLRDWDTLISQINEWVSPAWRKQLYPLVHETDRVLAEFLRGQVAVIILMSGFYATAYG